MINNFDQYNIYEWYKNIINELREAFLSNYKSDNELKMRFLASEVEKSIDLIANEHFLDFLNQEINRIATTNNSKEAIKNELLFYQALSLILSHNLSKTKIQNEIINNEALEAIDYYKQRIWELLNYRIDDKREIENAKSESEYYEEKLEQIVEILLQNWIDWKNLKLEDVVNKFINFWEISKILNIRFPDEKITDDILVEKVEKLWQWYETMRILISYLINKWIILKVNWWWYKINSNIESLLKNEKIIRPRKNEEQKEERKSVNIIKSWDIDSVRMETFELVELEQESDIDKANKEIERLKQELIKSETEKNNTVKKSIWLEEELRLQQKKSKKLQRQIKALKKELKAKWKTKEEIKRAIEIYKENN